MQEPQRGCEFFRSGGVLATVKCGKCRDARWRGHLRYERPSAVVFLLSGSQRQLRRRIFPIKSFNKIAVPALGLVRLPAVPFE